MAQLIEELANGVRVRQVTSDPAIKSNIYCERPYCSDDGRSFLYARLLEGDEAKGLWEYVLCDFGSWEERVVGRGSLCVSVSYDNDFYYLRGRDRQAKEFVRIDLSTGASEVVFDFPEGSQRAGHPTVSPGGRYIAYHIALSYSPQRFGIELADTKTGERRVIYEDPFLCNAHLQFEPSEGRLLQVQHNRGCEFSPSGERIRLVGEEGATVFLLDIHSGEIARLPVGKPYTTPLTGHQTWVGATQQTIMTVRATDDFDMEKGNILVIRAGENYRQIGGGHRMNHIGCTPCGRYFCADGIEPDEILVGCPQTGRIVVVCASHSSYGGKGFGQQGHPHAYLSPDYRWVVFNSDRTETPQTYVASIPPELLAELS